MLRKKAACVQKKARRRDWNPAWNTRVDSRRLLPSCFLRWILILIITGPINGPYDIWNIISPKGEGYNEFSAMPAAKHPNTVHVLVCFSSNRAHSLFYSGMKRGLETSLRKSIFQQAATIRKVLVRGWKTSELFQSHSLRTRIPISQKAAE